MIVMLRSYRKLLLDTYSKIYKVKARLNSRKMGEVEAEVE